MAFVRVANVAEVAPGNIQEVLVEGKTVAVANVEGEFFAIDNACLHRGGPLARVNWRVNRYLPVAWLGF